MWAENTHFSAERWNEIFTHHKGKSAKEISQAVGKSHSCVLVAAQRLGHELPKQKPGPRAARDWDAILKESETMSDSACAKKYNISKHYLHVLRYRRKRNEKQKLHD